MTVAEVKKLLKIDASDTSNDEFFETTLPLAIEFAQMHCKNEFASGLPGGVKLGIAKMLEQYTKETGVTSEKIADLAKNYADPTLIDSSILNFFKPYINKKVVFV